MQDATGYYAKLGGVRSSDYPYIAGKYGTLAGTPLIRGVCTESRRIFLGQGQFTQHTSGLTNTEIKTMLMTYGPLAVGVYVNTAFHFYQSGVFNGCPSWATSYQNHAVLLIGWDSNGDWLIQNSWGTSWGVNGTMTLSSVYDCGISGDLVVLNVPSKNTNVEVNMNIVY